MISIFVREQKRYTQKDLCEKCGCSEEKVISIIRRLKEYGVLKTVKASDDQKNMSDLLDEDIEVVDVEVGEKEYLYVFTFVGIVIISGIVLKCYPKYLLQDNNPKEELCQVLKVLEKYNSKEQIIRMFNDSNEGSSFNLLAVLLFLVQDYYENGVYSNSEEIVESNGVGEILWDKTINETFSLLSHNRPYYIDILTRKRVTNECDYFQRLHECILTKASKELCDADLLEILEITEIDLSDETLEDFGEKEYILYRIEQELNTQFNTRKQLVLKTVYAYINYSGSLVDTECMSMFGTNSFNLVWEKICADILNNQLETRISDLKMPLPLRANYDPNRRLTEIIEKPLWTVTNRTATDSLIPDIVTICGDIFIIFDAKYYNAQLENGITPKGQPGIESVTKQYLYQLAYQRFIQDHGFATVKNCFLLPTENSDIEFKGKVKLEMLSSLGLQDIQVRFIPASMVYGYYLAGQKIDINALQL